MAIYKTHLRQSVKEYNGRLIENSVEKDLDLLEIRTFMETSITEERNHNFPPKTVFWSRRRFRVDFKLVRNELI